MKTDRKSFYRVIMIFAVIIAGSLSIFLVWQHWIKPPVLISREEAIQHAIEACNPGYGLAPVEQPTGFETELTTYEKAPEHSSNPSKAQRPVYVVKMTGKWLLVGGPPPAEDNPVPVYFRECTQVIDAQTGEWLSYPIE